MRRVLCPENVDNDAPSVWNFKGLNWCFSLLRSCASLEVVAEFGLQGRGAEIADAEAPPGNVVAATAPGRRGIASTLSTRRDVRAWVPLIDTSFDSRRR